MITVRLSTGQILTFPDNTPEDVIRRAKEQVLSGEADRRRQQQQQPRQSFDLSDLRPRPTPPEPPPVDDPRARTEARLRAALPDPVPETVDADSDPRPLAERVQRSPEWWQSVTGSPDDKSIAIAKERENRRRLDERDKWDVGGIFGLIDRGTYYEDSTTGERFIKRVRSVSGGPIRIDPEYRPRDAIDRLSDVYEMEGRGIPDRERRERETEAGRAAVGGVPGRIAASEVGMLMPLQAIEAAGAGVREEFRELAAGRLPQRTGEAFTRGAKRGWVESDITKASETINREIVEPDREWLAQAASAAGLSPAASAAIDSAQLIAGEALNPGNWIGLDLLRSGTGVARRGAGVAERAAELEARGGARTIETGEGLVSSEYGTLRAGSEIDQAKTARSGRYAPWGDRDPLIYHDPHPSIGGLKGTIPDALRRVANEQPGTWPRFDDTVPWREHRGGYGRSLPIPEPEGPRPTPRSSGLLADRSPIPIALEGGTPEARNRILRLWDYASRRHPRIASEVRGIRVSDEPNVATFDTDTGILELGEGADIGTVMHEMTHAAQMARARATGQPMRNRWSDVARQESTAIRRGEVYSRVPVPESTTLSDPGNATILVPRRDAGRGGGSGSGRLIPFERHMSSGGGPADGESWFDRVSRWITQADERDIDLRLQRNMERDTRRMREAFDAESEVLPSGDVVHSRTFDMDAPGSGLRAPLPEERGEIPGQISEASPGLPFATTTAYADSSNLRVRNRGEVGSIQLGPGSPPLLDPLAVRLPEEIAAERMGWKLPDGSPRPTRTASAQAPDPAFRGSIDPITTPDGQTNIAAQVDPVHGYFGDPEVAGYVIEESNRVFHSQGPPQTWSTLEEMAVRRGLTTDQLLADRTHWNVMPPEVRLRTLYVIKGKEQTRNELQAKLAAGTATDADRAQLLQTIETIGELTRLSVKSGSAYGRALNSLKMEARNSLLEPQMLRQRIYKQHEKQIDADAGILDALARLDPQNPEELMAFQRLVDRPKFREYVQEYWIASVLSGPATHERNLIGNAVNAVMENAVVRPLSAGFDAARVAGTNGAREIFLRETPEAIVGLTRGIRLGARRGLEVLKRGYPTNTHGAVSGKLMPVRSAFARSQNRVVREVVGPVVTMPLRLLSASDELFKAMNHTAELYAQAAKSAARAGLRGREFSAEVARLVQNPTDEMIEAADSFALKATFNDETSAIGKAIMNLRDLPRVSPESRIGQLGAETYRGFAGFIIPFVRIADRLMVRGFEYTPLGAVKAVGARQAGNLVESADLAARSAIGSVIMAYAGSLAMEGRLTAGAPTDERERAAFYEAEKQPWSVRTEDGTWIPYGGLQPVGTPFAIAAAAWKGWREHGEEPDAERLGHAAAAVGQYVTDQSYMEGLSKFLEAIEGGEGSGRAFSNLAAGTAGGFAPYSGLQRSIAQAIDPRVIDAKTIGDKLKRNIPGLSLSMRAKLTPWGEEVVPVGGRLRAVLAPGSILLPSQENEDPLDRELAELGIPLGNVGKSMADKLPKRPRTSATGKPDTDWLDRELGRLGMPLGYVGNQMSGAYGNGKSRGTWKLDDEEWHLYQQTAGRATRRVLERLFSRADYAGWDSERQRDEAERAIGAAREYAKMWAVRYHRANRPRTVVEAD